MLSIDNLSRNTRLIDRGRVANTFWTRFKGLTFVRQLDPGQGLLITHTNSIHTHFMLIPIDVLYVNSEHVVIDAATSMKPWRMAWPRFRATYVIEMPAGTIAKSGSQKGDQLQLLPDVFSE